MMSRKHFRAFAAVIAEIKNPFRRWKVAKGIGLICKQDNPNFDWSTWDAACKVDTLIEPTPTRSRILTERN